MDWTEPPFRSREERAAYNEAFCRELNQRKAEWMKSELAVAGFRCECAEMNCGSRFPLSASEWKEARSDAKRFVVAPGHVAPDVEAVIKEDPGFWIVEKQDKAGEIAAQLE